MSKALMPCPFCGAVPRFRASVSSDVVRVECMADSCRVGPEVIEMSTADAVAAWNHRAPPRADPEWRRSQEMSADATKRNLERRRRT